ncbi:hypothetical protein G9A89_004915 [Geosiphon pyriformis]|nr:hypothetical protein G9A89_004915 [Geosiphon pyriformis]
MLSRAILLTLSFLSAILISAICGTQYLFSVYGPALAHPDMSGPRKVTLFASVVIFTSFFCLAFTYNGTLPPVFALCALYLFLTGAASSAGYMSVLTTQGKNFPNNRGVALGTPSAFFGLSAFIYSQVENFFFQGDTFNFILFLGISTGLCTFIGTCFLVIVPQPSLSSTTDHNEEHQSSSISNTTHHNERTPLISKDQKVPSQNELDIGGWQLFHNNDARTLFLIMLLLGGSGLMYINNVGSIIKSLFELASHPSKDTSEENEKEQELQMIQNFHVSLLSISSCLGRLTTGFFSDITKNAFQLRRLWYLVFASMIMCVGQLIGGFFVTRLEALWISTMLVGLGYGVTFGITPPICSEWFGSRRFGSNWGFLTYSFAFGGQVFNLLFGLNRDYQHNTCSGVNCYNLVFWATVFGSFISMILVSNLLLRRVARDKITPQETEQSELTY